MKPYYLNTDLCLISMSNLIPLAEAVGNRANIGYCGKQGRKWFATISSNGSGHIGKRKPAEDVMRLMKVFANLKGPAKTLWMGCKSREMNIGWQSSEKRPEGYIHLDPSVLADLAKQRVTLAVTIYPSCENDIAWDESDM